MSALTALVFAMLVGGVVVTALPNVPGGLALSLAGVYLHWWAAGEPSTPVLAGLTLLGVAVGFANYLGPVIAGKLGGTPAVTTALGGTVGAVCFLIWGVAGLVAGTLLTVFLLEYLRRGEVVESLVAAVVVIVATFAEKAVRVTASVVVLVVMIAVVVL